MLWWIEILPSRRRGIHQSINPTLKKGPSSLVHHNPPNRVTIAYLACRNPPSAYGDEPLSELLIHNARLRCSINDNLLNWTSEAIMRCFDQKLIGFYYRNPISFWPDYPRLAEDRLLPYEHSGLLHNHVRQEAIAVNYVLRYGIDIRLGYVQADRC